MNSAHTIRRYRVPFLIFSAGICISFWLFFLVQHKEMVRVRNEFAMHARDRSDGIRIALEDDVGVLYSLRSFFMASQQVDREEFRKFTADFFSRYPNIVTIAWLPRVIDSKRAAFEEAVRTSGFPDFSITERDTRGRFIRAPRCAEYFPIYYIENFQKNRSIFGFNSASMPERDTVLRQACDTGSPMMTRRIDMLGARSKAAACQIYLPFYRVTSDFVKLSDRRENLAGSFCLTFNITALVEKSFEKFARVGIDCYVFDVDAKGYKKLLYRRGSPLRKEKDSISFQPAAKAHQYNWSMELDIAGKRWCILFNPTDVFIQNHTSRQPWIVFILGVIVSATVGMLIAGMVNRSAQVRLLVDRRTAELQKANEALKHAVESQLRAELHTQQLAAIVESSDDAIVGKNLQGKIISWNTSAERLYGYTAEEIVGKPITVIVPSEKRAEVDTFLSNIERGETIRHYKTVRMRKDGSRVYVSVSISPIKDVSGNVVGASTIARDITEEHQREQTLRLLERAITSTSCGILISDPNQPDNPIIFCNHAFETITGYSSGEIIGKNCRFLQGPDTDPAALMKIRGAVAEGGECTVVVKNYRKDGTTFWNQLFITPLKDKKGGVTHYIGVQTDVSELKRAEDTLRKLTRAVEQSPASVVITDTDGKIEYVNPIFTTLTGYRFDEVIGKKPSVLKSGEKTAREYAALWETISSGNVWRGEFHNKKKNGELYWEYASISPVFDPEGKITDYIAVKEDITERKRMEEQLLSVTTMQKAILDSANYSIISTDAEGVIQTFNAGAERMLGYTAAEMVGKEMPLHIHDIQEVKTRAQELSPDMTPGFGVFVAKAAMGIPEEREWTYIRKDGSRFPVLLSVTALLDRQGSITGYLGVASDITHRKLVEEAMAKAKEAAESANRAKSDFLATMSHEIRTPMNAIIGMADLLSETTLSAEQEKYVGIFKSAGETLLNLINDILDLSKIESGNITLEKIGFDLYEVVEKAAEVMAVRAHQKGIELIYDIQPDVSQFLVGDPVRLRQIILNLLGNAIKFTEQGEVFLMVEETSSEAGDRVLRFLVKDTGIGIPEDTIPQLFEKFVQADSSITRKYGGSGLGLSISKKLVEMMGGAMSVKSEEGKGSIFSFTARFGVEKKMTAKAPASVDIKGIRTLVVDDNATNRMILKQVLSRCGAVVAEAEDGDVGLAELRRAKGAGVPYELVLLDCRMPHKSGFEVAACVKEEPSLAGVSMLMLTSDNRGGDIAKCRELGIGGYLIKPLKRSELLEAIRSTLGKAEPKAPMPEKPVAAEPSGEAVTEVLKEAAPAAVGAGVTDSRKLKILLVEDSEDNRFLIQSYLKSFPYQTDVAENGVIAVKKFTHGKYDIVLMDMQMPVMDGYTATRTIREWEKMQQKSPTTIVALTAYAFKEDIQKTLDAGCTACLNKPIKKAKLLETIAQYT